MNNLIERMLEERKMKYFSANDVASYIRKDFTIDNIGNIQLPQGFYSIDELEAIIICAANEKGMFRG